MDEEKQNDLQVVGIAENSNETVEHKTFTEEEVENKIFNRLRKQEKSLKAEFYSKLGIKDEDELNGLLDKIKNYDQVVTERDASNSKLAEYEAAKVRATYVEILKKQNVDDDCLDYVFNQVTPEENESTDDYGKRVKEFLGSHKKFIKSEVSTINTSINFTGKKPVNENQKINDFLRG